MTQKIALIGCGKMGEALLRGWLKAGIKARFIVVDPHASKIKSVKFLKRPDKTLAACDIFILAVKPQVMNDVCASLKPFVAKDALILSIAAGRSLKSFEKIFGKSQPVIRSMPNIPAAIQKGMTVAVANKNVTPAQKKRATALLASAGKLEWVKNENLINAVTAVSGSGPAYVFHLAELMAEAGRKAGLSPTLAATLARQTIIGSAALLESSPTIDAATLRKNVTSPKGTTEAALKILMNGEMQKLFDKAIAAAKKRGEELST